MQNKKIVLAGGSGFLGSLLADHLNNQGFKVVILSRKSFSSTSAKVIVWDGETLDAWSEELEGASALINLAGRTVDCRYTEKNKKQMLNSRILSTRVLGKAVSSCKKPPRVWLNSSTATIYEHTYGASHGEGGRVAHSVEAKDEYSVLLASLWEDEFKVSSCPGTRKIILRTALVFDKSGSVYKVLKRLAAFGLGGKMGHGKQIVSWIHSEDFLRAIDWLILNEKAEGVYNLAAPNPLSNSEMMHEVRKEVGAAFGLPATKWMLEIGAFILRTETELIIKSRNVVPDRLLKEGFKFNFLTLKSALLKR